MSLVAPARALLFAIAGAAAMLAPGQSMAADIPIAGPASQGSLEWRAINDGVMGGVSEGAAAVTPEGALRFSGAVSLANNGGFASIRSAPLAVSLEGARGLLLEVRGDGKRYKLNLKTEASFDGVQYQAGFQPPAGQWTRVALDFASFSPSFRGRPVRDAPALDPAGIVTLGLMISDRQAGAFALEVRSISAYVD